MSFYQTNHIYSEILAPVRKGRNKRLPAGCDEGKAFPLLIQLIYLYLEKIAGGALLKTGVNMSTSATSTVATNAIKYAGDWNGFASSMASFDTWSGVITSGAGSLVTNSLNLSTIGDNGVKVTGFSSMNISDMQSLNSVVGGLASSGLEYGLTGKTTLNVLNIADLGINSLVNRAIGNTNAPVNASCGLLELHLDDSQGASFALGTGGTDLSIGTVASAARGFDVLKTNFEINHYTNKNELQNAAIALREQYGFGGKAEKNQLKSILNGKTELKTGSGDGKAQTVRENGKRVVYLNNYSNDMTREEQLKLGITLGHEAYRDGVKGDELTQKIETRNAVAGHTDMMTRMLGDSLYSYTFSGIIAGDTNLQMDLLARSLGDDVFNDYVDGMYDSSGDFWRFNLDGTIEDTKDRAIYREIIKEDGTSDYEKLEDYEGSRIDALVKTIGIDNFEKMAGIGSSILSFVKSLNSDESYEHILGEMYMAKHGYTYSDENDMWEGGNGKIPGLGKNDSLGVIRDDKTGEYTFFTAGLDFTREDNAFSVYDDGKGGYKDRKDVSYEDRDNTDVTFWMKNVFTGKNIARETFDNAFTSVDNVYHQNSIVSEYFNMRLIDYDSSVFGVNQVGLFSNADTAAGNHIGITGYDGVTNGRYLYHPTDQKATMEGCFGPMSDSGVGNFNSTNPSDNLNGYTGAYHFQQQLNLYHSLGIYNGYQFNVHLKGKLK